MFSKGKFVVEDHALLFGLIAKKTIEEFGQQGEEVIEVGVRQYGRERGQRKAKRVKKTGDELNLINYFAYKAWEVDPKASVAEFELEEDKLKLKVKQCPWYKYWRENGFSEYAHLYCCHIDSAILKGYQKELELKLETDQSSGADYCDFYFKRAKMTEEDLELIAKKREEVIEQAVKSWRYHTRHLYRNLKEVIEAEFGIKGSEIIKAAKEQFLAESFEIKVAE